MVTLMLECRVADYDAWRAQFEEAAQASDDVHGWQIWRDQDDPNLVVVFETFESREIVEGRVNSAEVRAGMAAHGIDVESMRLRYLDDVGTG